MHASAAIVINVIRTLIAFSISSVHLGDGVVQLERSTCDDAGFARAVLVGKTQLGSSRGAVSTVSANTLRDIARGSAAAAKIGPAVCNVEGADVGARVREAGCAVGQAIQREVPPQRLPVQLSLQATQAFASRVQMQSVTLQQSHIEGEVLRLVYGRVDLLQARDFLPVAVCL